MRSPSATNATPKTGSTADSPDRKFPKSRRLLQRREFQRVYKEGVRVAGPLFALFLLAETDSAAARVGLSVSRKVGNAVIRNRVKRLLREACRLHWDWFPARASVVLNARTAMRDAELSDVETELERQLRLARRKHGERREPSPAPRPA